MMENNYVFTEKHIWKHRAKNDVLVTFFILKVNETKNSNLFDKNAIFSMKKGNLDES